MEIRVMNLHDYNEVYALWKETPGMGLNDIDDSREGIGRYLTRNPETCFVAVDGGEITGVILSGHDGRRGFIYHMAVMESKRLAGVGGALLERAIHALRREGISKAALVVFRDNAIGNAFWEGRGFSAREDLVYRNKVIAD